MQTTSDFLDQVADTFAQNKTRLTTLLTEQEELSTYFLMFKLQLAFVERYSPLPALSPSPEIPSFQDFLERLLIHLDMSSSVLTSLYRLSLTAHAVKCEHEEDEHAKKR